MQLNKKFLRYIENSQSSEFLRIRVVSAGEVCDGDRSSAVGIVRVFHNITHGDVIGGKLQYVALPLVV